MLNWWSYPLIVWSWSICCVAKKLLKKSSCVYGVESSLACHTRESPGGTSNIQTSLLCPSDSTVSIVYTWFSYCNITSAVKLASRVMSLTHLVFWLLLERITVTFSRRQVYRLHTGVSSYTLWLDFSSVRLKSDGAASETKLTAERKRQ